MKNPQVMPQCPFFVEATNETIDQKLKEYGLVQGAEIYYNFDNHDVRHKYEIFMHNHKDGRRGWMVHFCKTVRLIKKS